MYVLLNCFRFIFIVFYNKKNNLHVFLVVPSNFHEILMRYTRRGYRVLGLAWRPLPDKLNYTKVQRMQR